MTHFSHLSIKGADPDGIKYISPSDVDLSPKI